MTVGKFIIALIMGQLLLCSVAWSEFRVSPSFFIREEYNDNIDLEHDAESDFVTLVGASYDILWLARQFDIKLSLGLEYEKYLQNSEKDDLRPRQGTYLESTFNLYRDIVFLRISDTYERVVIDEGDEGGIGNNLTNLTDSNRLEINPYALIDISSTMQLRLDYQYENIWYDREEGDDAEYHRYSATLTKALTPHITSSFTGRFTQYRPKDPIDSLNYGTGGTGNDSNLGLQLRPIDGFTQYLSNYSLFNDDIGEEEYDRLDLNIGLQWQPVEQLVFSLNAGRSWLDYEFSNDYDSTLFGMRMDYQFSRTLNMVLAYEEDINVSVVDGAREQKKYSFTLGYEDRISAWFELFNRTEDYLEYRRQNDVFGGSLGADIPLSFKHGFTCLLSYTDYEEDNPSYEEDYPYLDFSEQYQRYGLRLSLYRELRLGRFSVGYTYNRNVSDTISKDYTNNIVFAELSLRW